MYPHNASEGADARDDLDDHLAADTVGESVWDADDLDGATLDDELRGRPAPPFRTPHPGHGSS